MFDAWSPDLPAKPSSLSAAPPRLTQRGRRQRSRQITARWNCR